MEIKLLEVNAAFSYLWLKHITGYNLSVHCARCLLGEYNNSVSPELPKVEHIPLEHGVHYLCGVSKPYNWHKNFHLAFMYQQDETIDYSNNGIHVVIENAKQLEISDKYISPLDAHYNNKAYYTCRNWQFAYYLDYTQLLKNL